MRFMRCSDFREQSWSDCGMGLRSGKFQGDNYIDFGLYSDNLSYSDYVNGFDQAILLDFNVDGNIWDLM